jgi:hypothetical protein
MKTAHLLLTASAALIALVLVASAWAAPGADGGSESGGARALPVLPSSGGGSEPAPDVSGQLGGASGELPQTPPVMPPLMGAPGVPPEGAGTSPDTDLVAPLGDVGAGTSPGGESPQPLGDSSGGGFGFLATTGSEIVSLITAGIAMVAASISGSAP